MSLNLIKYGFTAGEISPKLYGRTDLQNYDLGCAQARNWMVNYRGGLETRPGTQFVDYVLHDDLDTKFVPFKFAPNEAQTYVVLFGDHYARFIQAGAYILELPKAVSAITQANPGVVTSVAHGFATGDWVKSFDIVGMTELNDDTFQVLVVDADHFKLLTPFGANLDTTGYGAYVSGGSFYRIYTISTPYAAADLAKLKSHQSRSTLRLTHPNYKVQSLVRISDTNWTIGEWGVEEAIAPPTGVAITPSATGTAGMAFAVTAVDVDGNESLPSQYAFNKASVNYSTEAGTAKVTWNAVADAVSYRVYRSMIVPDGTTVSRAMQVGYLGTAYGPQFVDTNIIPDFTSTPPTHEDPFANGKITFIAVTNGGTGYTNDSVLTLTGTGTGFSGYPVVNSAGQIIAVAIVNGGKDYTGTPTVSASVGSGATFSVTLSPTSGNNPSVSSVYQQRQIFAATLNDPLGLWGSVPGQPSDFNDSSITVGSDAYTFELDSEEVAPIEHLIPAQAGLAMFSKTGLWLLQGDTQTAVTATNADATPQSKVGSSSVPPIVIDVDILHIEGKGATVRLITYTAYTRLFTGQDLSVLASHLMSTTKPFVNWDYASDPLKLVHAVRSDGALILLAINNEQKVFGWTPCFTKGLFLDVCIVQENDSDSVYYMVKRLVNGRWYKFIERLGPRTFVEAEDAWCVDCGLRTTPNTPAATLTPSAATGTGVVFTASAAVFASGDVGSALRVGGGKAVITAFTDSTHVVGTFTRDMTDVLQEDTANTPLPQVSGTWSLDRPFSSVAGLRHLEGQTVSVLADGNVLPQKVVTNGKVDLGTSVTKAVVGLGFTCLFQSLPPALNGAVIEGKRQRPVALALRVDDTRGLQIGTKLTDMMDMKERSDEPYGEPTRLQDGVKQIQLPSGFDRNPSIFIRQVNPLPASLLGYVMDDSVGDDSRARN